MRIRFLGVHKLESEDFRHVNLLVDDVLAVEAGALTTGLSLAAQQQLRAVLLTHRHYDHIRDIPAIGMNFFLHQRTLEVYGTTSVRDSLKDHLSNNILYPDFLARPPEKPALNFNVIEPGRRETVAGYQVLAVPVVHAVPTVGYQISATAGGTFFYTSDTGPGLSDCWRQVKPDLLIIEVTAPDHYREFAGRSGHLTPALLREELAGFREMKGYLPPVIAVHMNPMDQAKIEQELAAVAASLNAKITTAHRGMEITL